MLIHEEIKKDSQRRTIIQPFINKYKLVGINVLSEKNDWKKFEENNVTIALDVLYAKKIYPAYVSKHNSNCKKQVILLMIPKGKKLWHHLAVKNYLLY